MLNLAEFIEHLVPLRYYTVCNHAVTYENINIEGRHVLTGDGILSFIAWGNM